MFSKSYLKKLFGKNFNSFSNESQKILYIPFILYFPIYVMNCIIVLEMLNVM